MGKWLAFTMLLVGKLVFAQADTLQAESSSPSVYIGIGVVLIVAIIFVLYRRQKRKFNE